VRVKGPPGDVGTTVGVSQIAAELRQPSRDVENGILSASAGVPRHATSTSFQIGNRGGPGRPRRDVAVATANEVCKLARSFSQEALETLVKMMRNAKLPGAPPPNIFVAFLTVPRDGHVEH
jgi:hypothetical protein